jgi:hypothetical protein
MTRSAYPAAIAVASTVHAQFTRHLKAAREHGERELSPQPDLEAIQAIIDAAFWASLRREEGYAPRISLAWVAPTESTRQLLFERPLPLAAAPLARVAPAVERPGIHLGVWRLDDRFAVWGTIRTIPAYAFVLEVAAPGLLVIKHHRGEELGKYVNVAVLEADQVKIVDEHASSLPDCPVLVASLLGFDSPIAWNKTANVLVELAVSMRAHGRGGALLLVPAGTDTWRESIIQPISYAVTPPFTELADLMQDRAPEPRSDWNQSLGRAVERIAGLTAVDGAAVMTDRYEVLAFGAKIARREGSSRVEQVTVTEPIVGGVATVIPTSQLGGTRHFSAAQFIHDQHDAVALVASQDGRFTVFAWSPYEDMVHAHRVETLLL